MPDETPAATAPALGFSISAKLNNKREIVVQSHVPLDMPAEEVSKILDGILDQLDRQDTRYRLKDLYTMVEVDTTNIATHREQAADLQNKYAAEFAASGRRGEFRLAGQQKTNVDNLHKTIEGLTERVTKVKLEIAEAEKLLGVKKNGSDSGADLHTR